GGTRLGADDRVDRVLEDQNTVGYPDRQRAARTAFTDHDADGRHPQPAHAPDALGDDPRLPLLLCSQAGVRPGSVDEADDGQPELVGQVEHAHGLPVPARMTHAEVARDVLFGVASLLLNDDDDLSAVEYREAGHHGRVVTERAIT